MISSLLIGPIFTYHEWFHTHCLRNTFIPTTNHVLGSSETDLVLSAGVVFLDWSRGRHFWTCHVFGTFQTGRLFTYHVIGILWTGPLCTYYRTDIFRTIDFWTGHVVGGLQTGNIITYHVICILWTGPAFLLSQDRSQFPTDTFFPAGYIKLDHAKNVLIFI